MDGPASLDPATPTIEVWEGGSQIPMKIARDGVIMFDLPHFYGADKED